jgi:hypothetical protein
MMRRILTASAALVVALVMSLAPAQAQWSISQRSKFITDCIPGCERNPNVPEAQKSQCGVFCNCIATESERVISSAELDEIEVEARAGREHPKIGQFRILAPVCNRRAFGQ